MKSLSICSDITWLHISDFHTGKDKVDQIRIYNKIIEDADRQCKSSGYPNFVFVSGDIANKGLTAEYELYEKCFLDPLIGVLGGDIIGKIFLVPGNHDIDRSKAKAVQRKGVLAVYPEFLDNNEQGLDLRSPLLARFSNYESYPWALLEKEVWVSSMEGIYTKEVDVNGILIGILGINTSWLCDESDDYMQLTPGLLMVEAGLDKLRKCKKVIVMGHHPISWLTPSVGERLSALFSQKGVIYLHGHLHKTKQGIQILGNQSFVSIQAGCAYDTRDSEKWLTRIVWGGYNFQDDNIYLQPRKWSNNLNSWSVDTDHIPEDYQTETPGIFAIPTVYEAKKSKSFGPARPEWVPDGWELIDEEFLKRRKRDLSENELLEYFEGRLPNWSDALSQAIPKREIVKELTGMLWNGINSQSSQLLLMIGAGGEGKSTAFLQTLVETQSYSNVKILWRHDPEKDIPFEILERLVNGDQVWVVASDEGDSLINTIKAFLSRYGKTANVQFFITARDTDWINRNGNDVQWSKIANFSLRRLTGLSENDAKSIVEAWTNLGERGLGKLATLKQEEAVESLLKAAQEESESADERGAFLGAMLRVRVGDALKDHVANLMTRLRGVPIRSSKSNSNLLDALIYISAPHAFNLQYLSRSVLAAALELDESHLRREVLKPLGEEAAAEATGDFILVRHRAIAEAAIAVGEERFDYDVENALCDLVSSAIMANENGSSVPHLTDWRYLSGKFASEGNSSFGIRLAKAALKNDPNNSYLLVKLSQLYRDGNQAEQSLKVFRAARIFKNANRAYFTEWAFTEVYMGNQAMSALLNMISVSDNIGARFPTIRDIGFALVGLQFNLIELYQSYNRAVFASGAIAATMAARSISLDHTSFVKLDSKSKEIAEMRRNFDVAPANVLKTIYIALGKCYEQREISQDLDFPSPSELEFKALETVLKSNKFKKI
ncbi:metallophosphoesterase [Luteolibacter sp. SL250]|uniref:metallophosphoesterase family protein n=1 Tax=Luteolibacter sp. SL250 TaxID=2995170 RepID=UPI002270703B|nr:metallophosphoesterase [Luteolibacter sp. SL250]WAC18115.1 metallophosphoesterase [Luteolibacter sp. SL250]